MNVVERYGRLMAVMVALLGAVGVAGAFYLTNSSRINVTYDPDTLTEGQLGIQEKILEENRALIAKLVVAIHAGTNTTYYISPDGSARTTPPPYMNTTGEPQLTLRQQHEVAKSRLVETWLGAMSVHKLNKLVSGVMLGAAFGVMFGVKFALLLGVKFVLILGVMTGVMLGVMSGVMLGVMYGVMLGVAFEVMLGVIQGLENIIRWLWQQGSPPQAEPETASG